MSVVNLVSGGLDSTLIGVLAREEEIKILPLFIDYGQRAALKEWEACQWVHKRFDLAKPIRMDLSGFGALIHSGLTNQNLDVKDDAFTPGRNLLFLLVGSAYAYQNKAKSVSIGLLSEQFSLFPDQRLEFIEKAENSIEAAIGQKIKIITPLAEFNKVDVIDLATERGISGTYSCHKGEIIPCGQCIACLEFKSN